MPGGVPLLLPHGPSGAASCADDVEAGDHVARKGRARRFREARELKQGYDDGLFAEGTGTLADVADADTDDDGADDERDYADDDLDDDEDSADHLSWDPDHTD